MRPLLPLAFLAALALAACSGTSEGTPTAAAPSATATPEATATPGATTAPPRPTSTPTAIATPLVTPIELQEGAFVAIDGLTSARSGYSSMLLHNGRVLIVGGQENLGVHVVSEALLYDPLSNTFAAAGDTIAPRWASSVTRLDDGRVLFAGGATGGGAGLTVAEIYDPLSGTFAPTGDMVFPRYSRATALLADGRVLIVGGGPEGSLKTAELFDPATETFTRTGDPVRGRLSPTLVALSDGRALLVGDGPLEIYDATNGTFRLLDLEPPGIRPTATVLDDGRVLLVGGSDRARVWSGPPNSHGGGPATAEVVLFDPTTEQLVDTGRLLTARQDHAAVRLDDGRVLISGGAQDAHYDLPFTPTAELYDPDTGVFTATGAMLEERVNHSLTLLPDGSVLVYGISSIPASVYAERYLPPPRVTSEASRS